MTRQVEAALALARGGRPVEVAQLHVVLADGALRLRARGVVAGEADPAVRARPVQIDVSLSGAALLRGQVRVRRADVSGGDLTIVLRRSGETALAFGLPGAPADFVLPRADPGVPLAARAKAWLAALAAGIEGGGERLERLRLNRARLHLLDERTGAVWRAQDASVQFLQADRRLDLSANAALVRGADTANFALSVTSGTGLRDARLKLALDDALLRFLLGEESPVQAVQAPLQARLEAVIDREVGVRSLSLDASAGAGALTIGPDRLPFQAVALAGAYTLERDVLEISRIEIAGEAVSIRAQGAVHDLGALFAGEGDEAVAFSLAMPELTLSSAWFEAPLELRDFAVAGHYRPQERAVAVEGLSADIAGAVISAALDVYWRETPGGRLLPGVRGEASIVGRLHPPDVLRLWPVGLAGSAREWFETSVFEATLDGAELRFDITPEDLEDGRLEAKALFVSFPVTDAVVRIVEEMQPLRGGAGRTVIEGHSLKVDVQQAQLGGFRVDGGEVSLPDLSSEGRAFVRASGTGDARALVALILETPLEVRDKLPFEPDSIEGSGRLDLSLSRPLRRGVTAEDVPFSVSGQFEGVGAVSRSGDIRLSDWALQVTGDQDGLRFSGPLRFGGSRAALDWFERFGDEDAPDRSRYRIEGRLLTPDLDLLGVPARGFAQGAVGVVAQAEGRGLDFTQAEVSLDLTEAELFLPDNVWRKPPGARASAKLLASRGADGSLTIRSADLRGPGLQARGEAKFGADNRLLSLQAERVVLGDRYDLALRAGRSADGALLLSAQGARFDATPFLPKGPAASDTQPSIAKRGAALDIRVDTASLALREGAQVRDASVRIVNRNGRLDELTVQGLDPAGRPLRASLGATTSPSLRQIDLRAEDVGFALLGFIGENPLRGGRGRARGQFDLDTGRGRIDLQLEDFKVADLPLAARVFSSVASLQAFSDLVNGEGLAFSRLEAGFVIDGDEVRLSSGQAVGPAIGISASGGFDMKTRRVEADGVLVPAYRFNSALGQIPGLGRVFTSRKGEGVFGFTYSIRGTAERARIAVNPLSGLAPGIFRRMFESAPEATARAAEGSRP